MSKGVTGRGQPSKFTSPKSKVANAKRAIRSPIRESAGKKSSVRRPKGAAGTAVKGNVKAPNLKNLKAYSGLITGGTEKGLQKNGFSLRKSSPKSGGSVLKGKDQKGRPALFVDRAVKGYRSIAERFGMKVKGKDVDHVQAKKTLGPKVYSRLQAIGQQPNRSEAKGLQNASTAKLVNGVTVANGKGIRKINGYKQEKPMPKDLKKNPANLKERFNGYAGDAEAKLGQNAKAVSAQKRDRIFKKSVKRF